MAYGVVWGGLARQAGLSLGELVAMCLLVTAGTAQFVALPMLQSGAPAWLLVVTTYIVNLRHYLMAASLAPYFAHLSRGRLALLAHGITDESYALTTARFARQPAHPAYFAGSAAATYVAWYLGAAAGGVLGGRIPDPHRYGLDFVFPAVFIAILARTIQARGNGRWRRSRPSWRWRSKGAVGGTWHIAVAGLGASVLGIWLAPRAALGSAAPTPDPRSRRRRGDEARAPAHVRRHGRATYLTRAPLLFALARRRLPGWVERYFAALPIALADGPRAAPGRARLRRTARRRG